MNEKISAISRRSKYDFTFISLLMQASGGIKYNVDNSAEMQ